MANVVPVKVKHSKKLVGMDNHSNITNNKYTYMMAIVPLCKDDLVILPQPLARHLGDISPLVLVERSELQTREWTDEEEREEK